MGYRWSNTCKLDECKSINVHFLKKYGYFDHNRRIGKISWSCRGDLTGSACFYVDENNRFMKFLYTITDRYTHESRDVRYKTYLTTTPCNYGGVRYWFVCPGCNKRVAVVYSHECDIFRCRHCVGLKYSSQSADRISRRFGVHFTYSDLEKMRKKLRVTHYAGKLTKRYRRYLELSERMNRAMSWCSGLL